MTRLDGWDRLLHQFLVDRADVPFRYGRQDCCLFAADAIEVLTGEDVAVDFRGYSTEKGALKAIVKVCGGKTVEDAAAYCAAKYDMQERATPLLAQRGDLVLLDEHGLKLGLVHLNGRDVVVPGENSLRRLPLTSAMKVWRV